MKKFLFYMLFTVLAAASCNEKSQDPVLEITGGEEISAPAQGGRYNIDFTTNNDWECTVVPAVEWAECSEYAGSRGERSVEVVISVNEGYDDRNCEIRISSGGLVRSVRVVQYQAGSISISNSNRDVPAAGETLIVELYTNLDLRYSVSDATWITVAEGENTRALERMEYVVTVGENTGYEVREGWVAFFDENRTASDTLRIIQAGVPYSLDVSPSEIYFSAANTTVYLTVVGEHDNIRVEMQPSVEWCVAETQSGNNTISVRSSTNLGGERSTSLIVYAGDDSRSVPITQAAFEPDRYYTDMEMVTLQAATEGAGVNLVFMGDGYILEDMEKGGRGKYETDMRDAVEYFFSIYPYSRYRHYFNVFMVGAVSEERGVSNSSTRKQVDNKFETVWEGGNSTGIECNDATVMEFTEPVLELTGDVRTNLTVIMPINENIYAGTCIMWYDGFSVSMCPVGSYFREVVIHEAGGHGFAKLIDEYIYYSQTIPDYYKNAIINAKNSYGFYANADFYDDINLTTWRGFAYIEKYSMVSTFEGAYMFGRGIWRPEENSCMNDNMLYFNAPSRWEQVRRMHEKAGILYTFERFLEDDPVEDLALMIGRLKKVPAEGFRPLGLPIIVSSSSEHARQ